ncbi:hypothetical protein L208DRAFT_1106444, partial [Tricholoma matsutake]
GVFEWAELHNCVFGIKKFQLLDITKKLSPHPIDPRKRIPTSQSTLILRNQCILSKESARFLGVMVDNKLNWKGQYAAALSKGQDWIMQGSVYTLTSCGIHTEYFHQLYLSIAVPQMLYTADIFLTPKQNVGKRAHSSGTKQAILNKLAAIQRQAAIMITGAMRTTTTEVLEVMAIMANLMPFHLLVDKYQHTVALCLATLPTTHPLHKPVKDAAANLV